MFTVHGSLFFYVALHVKFSSFLPPYFPARIGFKGLQTLYLKLLLSLWRTSFFLQKQVSLFLYRKDWKFLIYRNTFQYFQIFLLICSQCSYVLLLWSHLYVSELCTVCTIHGIQSWIQCKLCSVLYSDKLYKFKMGDKSSLGPLLLGAAITGTLERDKL